MNERTTPLPPEVAAALRAGDERRVGEWLRETVEHLARSDTPRADALCVEFEKNVLAHSLLEGYLEWARGIARHLGGRPAEAADHLESGARIFNRRGAPDLADRVGLLLIDAYGSARDLARARRLAGRLKKSFSARNDPQRAALSLAVLAGAEDAADRVARAGELWREALEDLPSDGFRSQIVRANLANVAMLEGRLEAAVNGHSKISRAAASLGFDRLEIQAETNLAEAEFLAGRIDSALQRWHGAIRQAREKGYEFEEVIALLELATAEVELGDREAAAQNLAGLEERFHSAGLLPEALRARRLSALIHIADAPDSWKTAHEALTLDGAEAAAALLLVEVAASFGGVPAEDLIPAAERLRSEGFSAKSFLALALAARESGNEGRLKKAAALAEPVIRSRRATPWARMTARYALALAQPEKAGRHLAAAIRIADGLLGKLRSLADRSAFLSLRQDIYLMAVARLLDRGRTRDRHRALDLVHRFSSGWLLDELARREDRGDDPEVRKWIRLRRQLAALLGEMEGEAEPRIRRSGLRLSERLRVIEGELEGVERGLARRWSGAVLTSRSRDIGHDLIDRLPRGHRLLEFLPDGDDLIVFNLGADGLRARRINGVGATLSLLVASARFHLDARPWLTNGRGAQMDRALQSTLTRLGLLLLGDTDLNGVRTLWLAPHGMLYGIPWAALVTADGRSLVDSVTAVTVVPGSAAACRLLQESPSRPERFGFAGAPIGQLPEVAEEMNDLKKIIPDSDIATDSDRASFMRMLKICDAVHLAGHALFVDGLPAASGLKMSDGFISVHDLAASRLNASFLSFGVCSGARVTEKNENRVDGFLRALMAGGVKTVVGAISPVRDDVARTFSTALYRSLSRRWSPGEAWKDAVAEVREHFPSPAFWGPFQIFGDPRPPAPGRR